MSRTDLISDAFTMMRNAIRAGKDEVLIPYSNTLLKICEVMKRQGYVDNIKEVDTGRFKKIKVYLKYVDKKSVITNICRISKGGRRVYVSKRTIRPFLQGYGMGIISTSSGILTDKEAKEKGIGGEYIGVLW